MNMAVLFLTKGSWRHWQGGPAQHAGAVRTRPGAVSSGEEQPEQHLRVLFPLAAVLCHLLACTLTFSTGCRAVMMAPLGEVTFKWKYYPVAQRPQVKVKVRPTGGCLVSARSHCPPSALVILPLVAVFASPPCPDLTSAEPGFISV